VSHGYQHFQEEWMKHDLRKEARTPPLMMNNIPEVVPEQTSSSEVKTEKEKQRIKSAIKAA
jgi:hypothetical protein